MGACCNKQKSPIRYTSSLENIPNLTSIQRDKKMQKDLIRMKRILAQQMKWVKSLEVRRMQLKKTGDDAGLKSTNLDIFRDKAKRLRSAKVTPVSSNLHLLKDFKHALKKKGKGDENFWGKILLQGIEEPKVRDIRCPEYKYVLRRNFDLLHWNVLLRIFQVNYVRDKNVHFSFFDDHMRKDYSMKFNSVFNKGDSRGDVI